MNTLTEPGTPSVSLFTVDVSTVDSTFVRNWWGTAKKQRAYVTNV